MQNKSLLKKFLSFSYGSWIGIFIGIVSTPVITRLLTPEDFGKASMFTLALNILMVFVMFGSDQSFVRFFYEEEEEARGKLLYKCLYIPGIIMVGVAVIMALFYKRISFFLFREESFELISVLIAGIFFQILYRYAVLVVRMKQRGNIYSILEMLNKVLNFGFILLLYFIMGDQYEIIVYSTILSFAFLIVVAIYFEKDIWNIKNIFSKKVINGRREIFKFSSPLMVSTFITMMFQSFDRMAIKHWSNFRELGIYAAAFKIVAILTILQSTFSTFWAPVSHENFKKNPNDMQLYERMARLVSVGMFTVGIGTIMGKDILVFMLGKGYEKVGLIMPFLVFIPVLYTISDTTVLGINFMKKSKWHILIAMMACLVNIGGNLLLVPKNGAIGSAITAAITYIVFFTLRTVVSKKYMKADYGLKKVYSGITMIFCYALMQLYWSDFIINIVIGIFLLMVMFYMYKSDIKDLIKNRTFFTKIRN